jgi:hypothetical protein
MMMACPGEIVAGRIMRPRLGLQNTQALRVPTIAA